MKASGFSLPACGATTSWTGQSSSCASSEPYTYHRIAGLAGLDRHHDAAVVSPEPQRSGVRRTMAQARAVEPNNQLFEPGFAIMALRAARL